MTPFRRRLTAVLAILAAATTNGCASPKALLILQQQLSDAADAVNELRAQGLEISRTLDSLRIVVAKQDSTIFRLANATGVQIVK